MSKETPWATDSGPREGKRKIEMLGHAREDPAVGYRVRWSFGA